MREKTNRLIISTLNSQLSTLHSNDNSSLSEALNSSDNFLFKRVKGIKSDKKQEFFQFFSKFFKTCKMACRSDLESFWSLKEKKIQKKEKKVSKKC